MQKRIIIIVNILWTLFLAFNLFILFSYPDGYEGVGFLMLFGSFPSSLFFEGFHLSILSRLSYPGELITMAVFGYIQWNIAGYLLGLALKFLISTFKKFRH